MKKKVRKLYDDRPRCPYHGSHESRVQQHFREESDVRYIYHKLCSALAAGLDPETPGDKARKLALAYTDCSDSSKDMLTRYKEMSSFADVFSTLPAHIRSIFANDPMSLYQLYGADKAKSLLTRLNLVPENLFGPPPGAPVPSTPSPEEKPVNPPLTSPPVEGA